MQRQSARREKGWRFVLLFSGALLLADCGSQDVSTEVSPVRPGIDVLLSDSLDLVRGLRVGLITNQTGIGADEVPSIDRLYEHPEVQLVALFSPEHGIRGTVEAGRVVDDQVDARTELPIHSLYGPTRKPTSEMLDGIDALLFDIQDIGARYYTYIYTMALAMEAAGEGVHSLPRSRPAESGWRPSGTGERTRSCLRLLCRPVRAPDASRDDPWRTRDSLPQGVWHPGGPQSRSHRGWSRDMLFPDTGLPWRAPSPNMPDLESALHYSGTCLFEGTNLSVGRGTDRPFQWVGAPWLDGEELARVVSQAALPGVRIESARFTPEEPGDGKFDGVEVSGVRLQVTDAEIYDPTLTAVTILIEARRMSGELWQWNIDHFDRLAGTQLLRTGVEQGASASQITMSWDPAIERFRELRGRSLMYE